MVILYIKVYLKNPTPYSLIRNFEYNSSNDDCVVMASYIR